MLGVEKVGKSREKLEVKCTGLLKNLRLHVSLIFVILSRLSQSIQLGFVHSRSDHTLPARPVASRMLHSPQLRMLDDLNVERSAGPYLHSMHEFRL